MSIGSTVERWLDALFGRSVRKALEQVAHALMAGVPAFLVSNWLPIADALQVAVAVSLGLAIGLSREFLQNAGDPPDEETLFSIGRVPVNWDMIADVAAYSVGTFLAALLVLAL